MQSENSQKLPSSKGTIYPQNIAYTFTPLKFQRNDIISTNGATVCLPAAGLNPPPQIGKPPPPTCDERGRPKN